MCLTVDGDGGRRWLQGGIMDARRCSKPGDRRQVQSGDEEEEEEDLEEQEGAGWDLVASRKKLRTGLLLLFTSIFNRSSRCQ